jgi:hypothetical protein
MARAAAFALLLLATASVALGSPLCCVLGSGCCGKAQRAATAEPERECCPHCPKKDAEAPAPKPCDDKGCTCKSDVASHSHATADHAQVVALAEAPAPLAPAPAVRTAVAVAHAAAPPAPAHRSHPLLL